MTFFVVFKKEMLCILRDKRYFAMLLLPLILYPLLYGIIYKELSATEAQMSAAIPICCNIQDRETQQLFQDCFLDVPVTFVESENKEDALKNDEIYCILTLNDITLTTVPLLCEIEYNANSNYSTAACSLIGKSLENANIRFAAQVLTENGMDPGLLNTVCVTTKTISTNTLLVIMAPMLIVITILSGCTSVATDSFAGEKERGTMEQIAVTQLRRSKLLAAKETVIFIVTLAEAGVSLLAYYLSFSLFPGIQRIIGGTDGGLSLNLSVSNLLWVVLIIISFILLVSALFTTISILSKTAKQASSLLGLLSVLPSVLSLLVMYSRSVDTMMGDMLIPFYQTIVGLKIAFSGANSAELFTTAVLSQTVYASLLYALSSVLVQNNRAII